LSKITEYNKALGKCYANYEKLWKSFYWIELLMYRQTG
jgi:hypothetical protein